MVASVRSFVALLAFCLSFVLNPGYFGCASGPDVPDFGEAEMLSLLDEANATGPFDLEHAGEHYRLELTLEQKPGEDVEDLARRPRMAAFALRAHACGNRTFQASASACITTSEIPLNARVTFVRLAGVGETKLIDDQLFAGSLSVSGNKLTNGVVHLRGTQDTSVELHSPDGKRFELGQFRTVIEGFPITF